MRRIILICIALGVVVSALPAGASRVDEGEVWFVVKIADTPVGFSSELLTRETDTFLYRSHTDMTMQRMGTPLSMVMLMEEVSGADGEFRSARMEMRASITGMNATATRAGGAIEFTFETGGHTETTMIPWEDDAISLYASEERFSEWIHGDAPEMRFKIFDVSEGTFKRLRMVRLPAVQEDHNGTRVTMYPVAEYSNDSDTPTTTTWYDVGFLPFRTEADVMGMKIVVERVTPEQMAAIDLEPNFDIIRQSMIRVSEFPSHIESVQSVKLRLDFPHPIPTTRKFDGPSQKLVARGEDWVEVELTRGVATQMKTDADDLQPYLRPGRYIQSEHPSIVAVADSLRNATGRSGWELVKVYSNWVNSRITSKNYEQGFASALEAFESCTGDCTEHSVLLCALLRAAGIPARPAVGVVYYEGALVGHMWAEAYVDQWRTVDALDLSTHPIRLRVSAATDQEAVSERALMQAYAAFGGMTARVTAVSPPSAR